MAANFILIDLYGLIGSPMATSTTRILQCVALVVYMMCAKPHRRYVLVAEHTNIWVTKPMNQITVLLIHALDGLCACVVRDRAVASQARDMGRLEPVSGAQSVRTTRQQTHRALAPAANRTDTTLR